MRVGVAYVDVRVNMAEYQKDLLRLEAKAKSAVTRVNTELGKIGMGYSRLGKQATGASTGVDKLDKATRRHQKSMISLIPHVLAVTGAYMAMRAAWRAVMAGLTVGVDFEKKMSVVHAITRATEQEFAALSVRARELARTTVFTAVETSDALKYLAMAGFNVKESIAALPGVLQLALIGELELGRATDIATDTLRAFGLQAKDMTRVNDVFVATITRTNTNIEMMGQSMKFAAPVAKALGYDIEQVAAMIGILSQSGVKAGIAGRNLQQAFIRTGKAARRMGLDITSGLVDVLKNYIKIQEDLTKKTNADIAAKQVASLIQKDFGLIAMKSILILKDNIKAYEELTEKEYLSATEAERAALIIQDNVESSWKLMKSMITDISVSIFDKYSGGLKGLLQDITKWLDNNKERFQDWADSTIASIRSVIDAMSLASKATKGLWDSLPKSVKEAAKFSNPFARAQDLLTQLKIIEEGGQLPAKTKFYKIGKEGGATPDILRSLSEWGDKLDSARVSMSNLHKEQSKILELDQIKKMAALRHELELEGKAFELYATDVDSSRIVAAALLKEWDMMPASMKAIAIEMDRLAEVKARAQKYTEEIAKLDPEKAKAYVTAYVNNYKKLERQFDSSVSRTERAADKNAVKLVKIDQNKYEAQKEKAKQFYDENLAITLAYEKRAIGQQKEINAQKIALNKLYYEELNRISAQQIQDEQDRLIKQFAGGFVPEVRGEDRATKAKLRALDKLNNEQIKYVRKGSEAYFKAKDDELAYDKRWYRDKGISEDEINKKLAQREEENYIERLFYSDNFFNGIKSRILDSKHDMITWGEVGYEVVKSFSDSAEDHMTDFFNSTSDKFGDLGALAQGIFEDMVEDWSRSIAKMINQQLIGSTGGGGLFGLIGGLFGGGAAGAELGGFSIVGAGITHKGGRVGYDPFPTRQVPSSLFDNAPRLHSGLRNDEFPAILQKGETVNAKGSSSEGMNVTIHAVDAKSFVELMDRNPGAVLVSVNRALERNPGGRQRLKKMVA